MDYSKKKKKILKKNIQNIKNKQKQKVMSMILYFVHVPYTTYYLS